MVRTVDVIFNVVRNGGIYTRLYPTSAPHLRMNGSGAIKSSLTGDYIADDAVDWLTDRIQPVLVIDGVEHKLGIFLPATVKDAEDETGKSVHVEAYDQCWLVKEYRRGSRLTYSSSYQYLNVVNLVLSTAGIALINATPNALYFPDTKTWEPGTSYLEIVNGLLAEINYDSLWFGRDGAAMLHPKKEPTAANIDHILDSSDIKSLLLPTYSRELDIYNAPNVFRVICANPDRDDFLVATAINDNPQSKTSTVKRGRLITQIVTVQDIANQAELQVYADNLRNASMYSGEVVEVSTALLPGWGCNDVTALNYDEHSGIYIERTWDMTLEPGGTMTHRLERVVPNLG